MFRQGRAISLFLGLTSIFEICGQASFSTSRPVSKISQLFNKQKKVTRVAITQGHVVRDPIACVPIYGASQDEQDFGFQFMDIIKNDLNGCGLFIAIPEKAFLQTSSELAAREPRLHDWGVTKTRFLTCGSIQKKGQTYAVQIRAYDVNCGKKLLTFSVKSSQKNIRQTAHLASDQIFSRITGEKGMFNTSFVYVETVPNKFIHGQKITYLRKLKIMDQDGYNAQSLTEGNDLVMTPRFSPDGKTIVYLAYKVEGKGRNKKRTAQVYLLDLQTLRQRPLLTPESFQAISKANGGSEVNMTYAPRFSPDSKSVCFALIIKGKSAIYTMNLISNQIRRLTNHIAIDTSPAYSSDGQKIVFTSNRSGKEKIYIMNADGSNVRRVTNGEGKYSQPVFSPRGDFIAFSKQIGNQFYIGVVRPNGQEERIIVQGYLTESPCWSSNGRYIVFTRQISPRSPRKIYMVDLTGYFLKEVITPVESYDCAWSPLKN